MTGFEYTAGHRAATGRRGRRRLEIIRAIRDRYDGRRRNPFDEAECGHHYARAMASWSAFATWNDVWYDGRRRELSIGDRLGRGQRFWSNGAAFGSWHPGVGPEAVGTLRVVRGELALDTLIVDGVHHPSPTAVLTPDTPWTVRAAARA